MKSGHYWTWRKGRELLQFDSEETMKKFKPDPESWWGKGGPGQIYVFLAPRNGSVDIVKGSQLREVEFDPSSINPKLVDPMSISIATDESLGLWINTDGKAIQIPPRSCHAWISSEYIHPEFDGRWNPLVTQKAMDATFADGWVRVRTYPLGNPDHKWEDRKTKTLEVEFDKINSIQRNIVKNLSKKLGLQIIRPGTDETPLKLEEAYGEFTTTGTKLELRTAVGDYNEGKIDWKQLGERFKEIMWKAKTNEPNSFPVAWTALKQWTDAGNKTGPNASTVRLRDEGYGAVYTKDIKKDPKHTTNPTTGKVNRWTVKFDETYNPGGGAQTPPDENMIRQLIYSLKPNTAIVFYSLTDPRIRVYIRRTHDRAFDVIDSGGAEYLLRPPQDTEKLKMLINQIVIKHRRYNQWQTFDTISSRPMHDCNTIKKTELKEVIRELVTEMWAGWEEEESQKEAKSMVPQQSYIGIRSEEEIELINLINRLSNTRFGKDFDELDPQTQAKFSKQFEKVIDAYMKEGKKSISDIGFDAFEKNPEAKNWPMFKSSPAKPSEYSKQLDAYVGQKCPKCKKFHGRGDSMLKVLNPSNPTVYQCQHCGHKWNPDNEKSMITKVGDKSVLGAKPLYESKGGSSKEKLQNMVREVIDEISKNEH